MSVGIFDILMEIRKIEKQISIQKLKVQQSQQDLIDLQKSIDNIKNLQLKAQITLKEMERKSENTNIELENIHKTYDTFLKSLHYIDIVDESNENDENSTQRIEELKKQRDNIKDKLINAKAERENIASELNDVELQISIQKKKNAATILRLEKTLAESLQEEKNLLKQLESSSNIEIHCYFKLVHLKVL